MSSIRAITMPKWGIEMEEGMITDWLVEVGSAVTKGLDIIDIETAKIVNTLECPYSGTLVRTIADSGETLAVGALLGVVCESNESDEDIDAFIAAFKPVDASFGAEDSDESNSPSQTPPPKTNTKPAKAGGKVRVSPPVRRLAESLGVDLTTLQANGSRITKEMVEAAAAGDTAAPAAAVERTYADATVTPMSNRRKTIAARLVESKTSIPHYYLTADISIDTLIEKKAALESNGTKVSLNDLVVYCVARTLMQTPDINVNLIDDTIHTFTHANIAIAIATEDGLVAPVLHQAEILGIAETSSGIKELADRAQNNNLKSSDYESGSFTISNLGMYGIDSFQAIINPPQGAILALGAGTEKIVADGGVPVVKSVMTANLSCDHRVIDGAAGAKFLATLKAVIESADIT